MERFVLELIELENHLTTTTVHRHLFRREFDSGDSTIVNRRHALEASRRLLGRLLTSTDHEGELRLYDFSQCSREK